MGKVLAVVCHHIVCRVRLKRKKLMFNMFRVIIWLCWRCAKQQRTQGTILTWASSPWTTLKARSTTFWPGNDSIIVSLFVFAFVFVLCSVCLFVFAFVFVVFVLDHILTLSNSDLEMVLWRCPCCCWFEPRCPWKWNKNISTRSLYIYVLICYFFTFQTSLNGSTTTSPMPYAPLATLLLEPKKPFRLFGLSVGLALCITDIDYFVDL